MSVDLPHLHGILKDKTRARILELLEQRSQLSYVELQNLLEISHTGKLNYHLKMLGDLISKDEGNGRYYLREKGRVAVALLGKFQTMRESDAAALKVKLKLGLALGVTVAMAALSLFFVVVGIPGSSGTVALECSAGNSCSASSQYATTFTPTFYALIPLSLAPVAGFGFYKRKMILTSIAAALLLTFSIVSLVSIGILYVPFAIALIALISINRRDPRANRPATAAKVVWLFGGIALASAGVVIGMELDHLLGLYLLSLGIPLVLLAVPIFLVPLALSISLGYALMTERPVAGRLMMYSGIITSVTLPILLSGGL